MPTNYVAYGLQLSSFSLPGMTPRTDSKLPPVTVERRSEEELDAHWSGPGGLPPWRGKVGDGTDLTIEQGADGDTLFTYGESARYLLDRSLRALHCAPTQDGPHWQHALLGRVLPNVGIACGYEALHASAVESPAGVVAIAAPSGMGKTTLALELTRRGWPLVTDDVLILENGPEQVRAHPGPPHMNVAPDQLSEPSGEELSATIASFAEERWVVLRRAAREPRPVRAVCLLERGSHLTLDVQPLPAGPLPLVPYMLGLKGDAPRERRRFCAFANLAASASLLRLTSSPSDPPAAVADLLEQELLGCASTETAGVAW